MSSDLAVGQMPELINIGSEVSAARRG